MHISATTVNDPIIKDFPALPGPVCSLGLATAARVDPYAMAEPERTQSQVYRVLRVNARRMLRLGESEIARSGGTRSAFA